MRAPLMGLHRAWIQDGVDFFSVRALLSSPSRCPLLVADWPPSRLPCIPHSHPTEFPSVFSGGKLELKNSLYSNIIRLEVYIHLEGRHIHPSKPVQVTLRKDEARYPSINSLDACILLYLVGRTSANGCGARRRMLRVLSQVQPFLGQCSNGLFMFDDVYHIVAWVRLIGW